MLDKLEVVDLNLEQVRVTVDCPVTMAVWYRHP
jgi:hypothetical protein